MKTLHFKDSDDSKKAFEVIFHGLIVMGNQNTQKGLTVLKREISILDKIESISKPCECGKTVPNSQEPDRELIVDRPEVGIGLTLDDNELDLLCDYISRVPWSIGKPSRLALQTLDWLKSSDESPTV